MKRVLLEIKNLFPYLLLIATYFFFINIEARNGSKRYPKNFNDANKIEKFNINASETNDSNIRIKIPVIPYNQKN